MRLLPHVEAKGAHAMNRTREEGEGGGQGLDGERQEAGHSEPEGCFPGSS